MPFDPTTYSAEVCAILALDAARAHPALKAASAFKLFAKSRAPEAALCGLYVYFSCMDEAHALAQDLSTPDGSYWHAIVHRAEPDAANAGYWFGQTGAHPVFPKLRERAAEIGVDFGPRWDPIAFIRLCETARKQPGSDVARQALEVQRAEWELLFDYCAAQK